MDTVQSWVEQKIANKSFSRSSDSDLGYALQLCMADCNNQISSWLSGATTDIITIWISFMPSRSPRCGDIYDFFGYFKRSEIGIFTWSSISLFSGLFLIKTVQNPWFSRFLPWLRGPLRRGVSMEKELLFPRHDKGHHLVQFQNSEGNGSVNDFSVQDRKAKSLSPSPLQISISEEAELHKQVFVSKFTKDWGICIWCLTCFRDWIGSWSI